jgi:hypothetical protein
MQNEDAIKTAIETSIDWQHAVDDFIECATDLGMPFTSGHIATALRVYRPEFHFSVPWIGERCQDLQDALAVQYQGTPAVQISRVCAGLGRTPAGTAVFTYAGDQADALAFPFEIDIPKPGEGLKTMPQEHPIQQNVNILPKLADPADMQATVHADKRLAIPRAAFSSLLHATGRALRGGDKVWVRFEDTAPEKAVVSLDQVNGSVDYDLQSSRGRVLFPKAGSGQFNHGDVYQCAIANDELVVDISQTV